MLPLRHEIPNLTMYNLAEKSKEKTILPQHVLAALAAIIRHAASTVEFIASIEL